eukprot:CAMPEP_0168748800 /NCGR_PEP_ID=MMETSP0724-20121128/16368_1 /TAXON_ID=265536 /ORGANISM="Amphiprora sp., Strain CCMP467" /LENGTH=178 /DNA_ID=CAMNT_0008796651 /DNA_START=41 /DNA_END=577 /DNA_ORIENTATION=-
MTATAKKDDMMSVDKQLTNDSSAKKDDTKPSSDTKSDTVCHILPCNIDYTGAVDGRQFEPQSTMSTQASSSTAGPSTTDGTNNPPPSVEAVAVRGHGLLAQAPPIAIPPEVAVGHVWEVDESVPTLTHETALSFQHVQEWHHEHLPEALGLVHSRTEEAVEWCSLAQALHAPLLVEEE